MNIYPEEIEILFMSYTQISFKTEIAANELEINWGDGQISTYRNQSYYTITHTYSNEGLRKIHISGSKITELNLSGLSLVSLILHCPYLEYLNCCCNELNKLDLSNCPLLEELYCSSNNIVSLNLSGLPHLQQVNTAYNLLEKLDISDCQALNYLYCSNNHLTYLKLGSNHTLLYLDLSNNLLEKETLNEIFRQFKRILKNQIIYYLQNPGSDFCDTKILQLKDYLR